MRAEKYLSTKSLFLNFQGVAESCLAIFLPALVMGNFMVLNLFLALLLNSFNCEELKSRKEVTIVPNKQCLLLCSLLTLNFQRECVASCCVNFWRDSHCAFVQAEKMCKRSRRHFIVAPKKRCRYYQQRKKPASLWLNAFEWSVLSNQSLQFMNFPFASFIGTFRYS